MPLSTQGTLLDGRYRVLTHLGSGGAASVVLCQDERLYRLVAVKRLHADSPAEVERRFLREARVGASLNHPNLVSIYDTATDGDSVLIVMEYVEGEPLSWTLKRGPLRPERVVRIVRDIGAALDHAHEHGVVHRDVKPGNVLLRKDGVAKLVDLGIATASDLSRITHSGIVLGTAAYMAPEQLEGGDPGPATDVYGLAAVAYEALTGRRPRSGRTPVEVAHQIATAPPPDLREHWPDAPPAAAQLLDRGMARNPAHRPRSAGELAAKLARALEGVPGAWEAATAPTRLSAEGAAAAGAAAGAASVEADEHASVTDEGTTGAAAVGPPPDTPAGAPLDTPAAGPPDTPTDPPPRTRAGAEPDVPTRPPASMHGGSARRRYGKRPAAAIALTLAVLAVAAVAVGSLVSGDDGSGSAESSRQDASGQDTQKDKQKGKANGKAKGKAKKEKRDAQAQAPPVEEAPAEPAPAEDQAAEEPAPAEAPSEPTAPATTVDPARGAALNDQGFALMRQGDFAGAVPILQQAVASFPEDSQDINYAYALYNLGRSLNRSGRPDEAIPYLEKRLRWADQRATVQAELDLARRNAGAE